MKTIALLLCAEAAALAQPSNYAFAGVSYGSSLAGTAIYARAVDKVGTYSFTMMDAVPTSTKPLTVSTQVATGIAQKLACISIVCLYVPGAAGVSWNGPNTGWGWSSGGLAVIQPKGWKALIAPHVRVVKSSVNNNSGYQLIGGLTFGWGF
jgi:hypothetical protein